MKQILLILLLTVCGLPLSRAQDGQPPVQVNIMQPNRVIINSFDNTLEINFISGYDYADIVVTGYLGNTVYQGIVSGSTAIVTDYWPNDEYTVTIKFSDGIAERHIFIK